MFWQSSHLLVYKYNNILEYQFTAPSIKNVQILSAKFCHAQDGPLYISHNLKGSEA